MSNSCQRGLRNPGSPPRPVGTFLAEEPTNAPVHSPLPWDRVSGGSLPVLWPTCKVTQPIHSYTARNRLPPNRASGGFIIPWAWPNRTPRPQQAGAQDAASACPAASRFPKRACVRPRCVRACNKPERACMEKPGEPWGALGRLQGFSRVRGARESQWLRPIYLQRVDGGSRVSGLPAGSMQYCSRAVKPISARKKGASRTNTLLPHAPGLPIWSSYGQWAGAHNATRSAPSRLPKPPCTQSTEPTST